MKKETKAEREKRCAMWRKKHVENQRVAADTLADFWLTLTRDCEGDVNYVNLGDWTKLLKAGQDVFWSRDHVTRNAKEQS